MWRENKTSPRSVFSTRDVLFVGPWEKLWKSSRDAPEAEQPDTQSSPKARSKPRIVNSWS